MSRAAAPSFPPMTPPPTIAELRERLASGGYIDAAGVAQLFGVSVRSIERAAAAGDLPSTRVPGIRALRFSPADVEAAELAGRAHVRRAS